MSTEKERKWGPVKTIIALYAGTIAVFVLFKDKIKEWWEN